MSNYLTAGRVAKEGGVNVQTVRYYERRRLLVPDRRTESGYRLYPPEAVRVIRFIKNAQDLGFTLAEIATLIRLRVGHKAQCGAVRRQAEAATDSPSACVRWAWGARRCWGPSTAPTAEALGSRPREDEDVTDYGRTGRPPAIQREKPEWPKRSRKSEFLKK